MKPASGSARPHATGTFYGLRLPPARRTAEPGGAERLLRTWIKTPGESDGECGNAPPAGHFRPRYALGLARRAVPPL